MVDDAYAVTIEDTQNAGIILVQQCTAITDINMLYEQIHSKTPVHPIG